MAERFKTERQTYNRLKWDPAWDTSGLIIGCVDRLEGIREIPFDAFDPEGVIPWHRVAYFRDEARTLWHRADRIDAISSADPPRPRGKGRRREGSSEGPGLAPLRFDPGVGAWRPDHAILEPAPSRLRVVTWNVLFDPLEAEARAAALIDALEAADADLIILQEVKEAFAARLLAAPWVRRAYTSSDRADGPTLLPYGQLVLSRIGLSSIEVVDLGLPKRATLVTLEVDEGIWALAAVHLTSNRAREAPRKRARQLERTLKALEAKRPRLACVVGDFNAGGAELDPLPRAGFIDLWPFARPGEDGVTFDPTVNALAKMSSQTGLRRRFDRIYVHRAASMGVEVDLLGVTPCVGPDLAYTPSDHYGLVADLDLEAPDEVGLGAPTHRSAVMVAPPEATWGPIQALRRAHDRGFARWMPHINLLYGFLPDARLEAAAARATAALRGVPPFEVELARLRRFTHGKRAVVWLEPATSDPEAWPRLQRALIRAFPRCVEQLQKGEAGFTPHLTVGRFPSREAADAFIASVEPGWAPIRFRVEAVRLISRRGEGPFEPRYEARLGGVKA